MNNEIKYSECRFPYYEQLPEGVIQATSFVSFLHAPKKKKWRFLDASLLDKDAMITEMLQEIKQYKKELAYKEAEKLEKFIEKDIGKEYYIYSPYSGVYWIKKIHEETNFKLLNKYIKDGNVYYIP